MQHLIVANIKSIAFFMQSLPSVADIVVASVASLEPVGPADSTYIARTHLSIVSRSRLPRRSLSLSCDLRSRRSVRSVILRLNLRGPTLNPSRLKLSLSIGTPRLPISGLASGWTPWRSIVSSSQKRGVLFDQKKRRRFNTKRTPPNPPTQSNRRRRLLREEEKGCSFEEFFFLYPAKVVAALFGRRSELLFDLSLSLSRRRKSVFVSLVSLSLACACGAIEQKRERQFNWKEAWL